MGTCVSGRICVCCPSTSRAWLPTGTQLTLGTSLVKKLPEAEEDITRPEVTAAAVPCKSREMQECQGGGENKPHVILVDRGGPPCSSRLKLVRRGTAMALKGFHCSSAWEAVGDVPWGTNPCF